MQSIYGYIKPLPIHIKQGKEDLRKRTKTAMREIERLEGMKPTLGSAKKPY